CPPAAAPACSSSCRSAAPRRAGPGPGQPPPPPAPPGSCAWSPPPRGRGASACGLPDEKVRERTNLSAAVKSEIGPGGPRVLFCFFPEEPPRGFVFLAVRRVGKCQPDPNPRNPHCRCFAAKEICHATSLEVHDRRPCVPGGSAPGGGADPHDDEE